MFYLNIHDIKRFFASLIICKIIGHSCNKHDKFSNLCGESIIGYKIPCRRCSKE